ncbi:MAG: D-glucuronyl C5-epimerase family protein [Alphaproteobacteria bacterium]
MAGAALLEIRRNLWRARKLVHYLSGTSYHNAPQGVGKAFEPGVLNGYFNDLTAKTRWSGAADPAGLPLTQTDTGQVFHFPIMLFQLALGHWDLWLLSARGDAAHRARFLRIADWAAANLDAKDGWACWHLLDRGEIASPYSSMAQGQGLSVLARAYALTGEERYRAAAQRAFAPLVDESSPLLMNRRLDGHLVFEEYPGATFPAVLNGWIFTLFGLYDYGLAIDEAEARAPLEESLAGLLALLPRYDTGAWSLYDLAGNLAGPFYHRLHSAQLQALAMAFPAHEAAIGPFILRFQRYERSWLCRARAILKKIWQKLRMRGVAEIMPAALAAKNNP